MRFFKSTKCYFKEAAAGTEKMYDELFKHKLYDKSSSFKPGLIEILNGIPWFSHPWLTLNKI